MPTGLGDEQLWLSATNDNTGTSTAFQDQSGNGNNGTASGTLVVADTSEGGTYAYDFDGTNDYVTMGDILDTQIWTSGLWSVAGWVKVKTGQTQANLIMKYYGNNREFIVDAIDRGSGIKAEFIFAGAGDASKIRQVAGDTTLNANQWYHIAVEFDNSRTSDQMGKIWVNGVAQSITVLSSAGTVTNIQDLSASLSLGAAVQGASSGGYRSGYSDDIRAYDRALTEAEITHLASSRGVEGPAPVGLGDEQMWFCPTLNQSGVDITGSATNETLVGSMAIVSDTQSGGTHAYDTPDGSTGGMSFTPPASTIASGQAASITVSMWADHTSFSTNYLFSLCENSFSNYLLVQGRNNDFMKGLVNGGINGDDVQFTRSSPMQHYVFEFTATTIKVWLSGSLVSTVTGTWSGDTWDRGGIGMLNRSSPTNGSQCTLDDIRVYGRTLTQAEITHLASSRGVEGPPPVGLGDEKLWLCPSLNDSPNDISGNGNDGTYQGGMGTVADTSNGGTLAYDFDGTNDYIDIQGLSGQYTTGSSHSTSLWVYQDAVQNQQYFNRYASASSDQRAETLYAEATDSRTRAGFKQSSSTLFATANNTNQSGVWYHLASTYNSTTNTQSIYKNGVSVASQVLSGDSNWATNYAEVGRASINGGSIQVYADCKMDDVRSFTRVLTQAEITHLATSRGIEGSPSTATQYNAFITHAFRQLFQTRLR